MQSITRVQPRRQAYPDLTGYLSAPPAPAAAPVPAPAAPAAPAEAPAEAKPEAKAGKASPSTGPSQAPVLAAAEWLDESCETALIGGKLYAVEPVDVDPRAGVVTCYALTSAAGDTYHVSDHRDQSARCTCADFIWRCEDIDPEGCKHVKAMVTLDCITNDVGRAAAAAIAAGEPAWTIADQRAEVRAGHRKGVRP